MTATNPPAGVSGEEATRRGPQQTICFVDTETTSLGHLARPWEIAVIRREADGTMVEHVWHVLYSYDSLPAGTSPEALRIGRWADRGEGDVGAAYRNSLHEEGVRIGAGAEFAIARRVHDALSGSFLVGVGVHFDAAVLSAMFRRHGLPEEPWHYAIVDLKAAAWGAALSTLDHGVRFLPGLHEVTALPLRSEQLAEATGVEPCPPEDRHTALGDARWAARWFDALTGGVSA